MSRSVSPYDEDILKELKKHWPGEVKIGRDLLSNPCIFVKYKGPWDVVYVLSNDGTYINERDYYVHQALKAIVSHCEVRDSQIIDAETQKKYVENFDKMRDKIAKEGFKDNLPEEGEQDAG